MSKLGSKGERREKSFDFYEGKRGLTWRSLLALIYIAICFQPGFAYLQLVAATGLSVQVVQWATIILFMELARLTGKPLTRQEIIVIFLGAFTASTYNWFLAPSLTQMNSPGWLYQLYFAHSPAAEMFGLTEQIPWFYSPTSEYPWIFRTFFHPSWIPIAMTTAAYAFATYVSDVCIGIIMYRLYVKGENLPFPRAIPVVEACNALIERKWTRMGVLSITTLTSGIYSLLAYVIPLLTRVYWGQQLTVIEVPWVDYSIWIQRLIPGIMFGFATSMSTFGFGFIIPLQVVVGMLIGSVGVYMIGNPILIGYGITDFAAEYSIGMTIERIWQRSFLHMWAMPSVGFAVAVGITPLLFSFGVLRRAFSVGEGESKWSIWWPIIPFLGVTLGLTAFDYWLAPDVPILGFLFLNTIWVLLSSLTRTRGQGYGAAISIPYMRELTLKTTGYSGVNGWFVPTMFGNIGRVQAFKICDMTDTRKIDFVIAIYVVMPIALVIGLFYTQSFWSLGPIPSSVFPGVEYSWPVLSTFQALFISPTGSKFFIVDRIVYSFIIGMVLYAVGHKLGFGAGIVGIAAGIASPVPGALTTFLGGITGVILRRRLGKWWDENVGLIVAGLVLGEGLTTAIGSSIAIVGKSIWALPY